MSPFLKTIFNPLSVFDQSAHRPSPKSAYFQGVRDGRQIQARYDQASHQSGHCGSADRGYGQGYGSLFDGGFGGYGNLGGFGNYGGCGDYSDYGHRGNHGNRGSQGMHSSHGFRGAHGSRGSDYDKGHRHGDRVNGNGGANHGGQSKPLTMQKDGNKGTVKTAGGYTIEATPGKDNGELKITAPNGKTTTVWGDPHVSVDGVQKFDFTDSGFTIGLPDGTRIEMSTRKLANGTSVLDQASVLDPKSNSGVRLGGLSSGSDTLTMNQGRADLLDKQIDNGVFVEWGADGTYGGDNGFGGDDQKIDTDFIKGQESLYAGGADRPEYGDDRHHRGGWHS